MKEKRAGEKSSNKLGVVIAALVAVVVLVASLFSLIHLEELSHLTQLKTTGTSSTKKKARRAKWGKSEKIMKNRFAQLTAVNPEGSAYVMHRVLSWMNLLYKPLTMKLI